MKKLLNLCLMIALVAVVAACSKKETVKPSDPVEPRDPVVREAPDVDTVDKDNFADPRNLTNPDSLLSQRVILFDYDQSTVRSEYRRVLAAHGQFMAANRSYNAIVEGHADERGTREYNLALGERRANSVGDILGAQGASDRQMESVSYGEERPTCTSNSEGCWQRNRRAEIVYPAN